jgi:hypothetical protein
MPILAWRAHDDHERPAAKADLERFLRRGHVVSNHPGLQIDPNDIDRMNGWIYRQQRSAKRR